MKTEYDRIPKIDLADYVPILQTIAREDKILKDDWVYPNEYAIIRRPDFEKDFEYRAQKVENVYPTNVSIKKYPHSTYVIEVIISGRKQAFYSSALKKVE